MDHCLLGRGDNATLSDDAGMDGHGRERWLVTAHMDQGDGGDLWRPGDLLHPLNSRVSQMS